MSPRTSLSSKPSTARGRRNRYSGVMVLSRAETKALYDKISKVYDLLSEHTEGPVREAGLRMVAPQPGETVLEIGFGTVEAGLRMLAPQPGETVLEIGFGTGHALV